MAFVTPRRQCRATLIYDSSEEEEQIEIDIDPTVSTTRIRAREGAGGLTAAATIRGPPITDMTFIN